MTWLDYVARMMRTAVVASVEDDRLFRNSVTSIRLGTVAKVQRAGACTMHATLSSIGQ
jgi:hypothetical protein